MGIEVEIRPADRGDVSACLEAQAAHGDPYFSEGDYLHALKDGNAIFPVAEVEGEVVGYIMGFRVPTKQAEAGIHSTLVHPGHRSRGIGSRLVESFVREALGRGVEMIFAEVEDGPDRFYERCGFRKKIVWYSMVMRRRAKSPLCLWADVRLSGASHASDP